MESSGVDTAGSTMSINQSIDGMEESAPSAATEFTTRHLQEVSSPVGISQNTFSAVVDEFKILRELITNLTKESDGKTKLQPALKYRFVLTVLFHYRNEIGSHRNKQSIGR